VLKPFDLFKKDALTLIAMLSGNEPYKGIKGKPRRHLFELVHLVRLHIIKECDRAGLSPVERLLQEWHIVVMSRIRDIIGSKLRHLLSRISIN